MKANFQNASTDWALVVSDYTTGLTVCVVLPGASVFTDCPQAFNTQGWDVATMNPQGSPSYQTLGNVEDGFTSIFVMGGDHYVNSFGSFFGIPSTLEVPVIGEVTLPDWALVGPEAAVFFLGFATVGGIRIFKAALRWFKRSSATTEGSHD